jgi:hypothetical protein
VPHFPEWFLVRRPLRPFVITLLSLAIALGASVGLAAPASASTDTSFTAAFSDRTLPILDDYEGDLVFGGSKSASSTVTGADVSVAGDTTCRGASGGTSWSCDFAPSDGYPDGHQTIVIHQQNADGTLAQNVLAFDVLNPSEEGENFSTTPVVSYSFVPGGLQLTTTESGDNDDVAGTQTFISGEGWSDGPNCPSDANYYSPVGTYTDAAAQQSCTLSYQGGVYVATQSQQATDGDGFTYEDDQNNGLFYVPENSILVVSAVANSSSKTVTVTGTADPSSFEDGAIEVLNESNVPLCQATDTGEDSADADLEDWTCTTSALGDGAHTLSAVDVDTATEAGDGSPHYDDYDVYITGGMSSATAIGTISFTAPGTPTTPDSSKPGDVIPVWSFTVSGDLTNLHPGDTITITGSGLPVGTSLDTILHSTPTDLGTVVAAADGTFTQTVTIPAGVELGPHTIQVTASGPGIVTTTQNQAITVTSKPTSDSGGGTKTGVDNSKPTASHGTEGAAGGAAIAPNILTRALTPIADVALHPNKIVSAIEIGLVLLLLAVLPAHLLNATIAEQSERFERRFGKARAPGWLSRMSAWFRSAPVVGGILVTVATGILFGFADPKFGWTLASLRLVLAAGIALFLVGYVANALTGLVARVQWNIVAAVSTRPYGLVLTIVGVLISRLLHFSPGFLIGLILGLTIQGKSAAGFAWRTVILRTSIVLIMAIAAWIGYSTLTLGGAEGEGKSFGTALLVETLVAITTEGVVALLVELLPLRFLEGERVYAHSRVLWGVFYFLTLVVFVLAVVPWEGNWDALHGSLWIWIVVLAAFAAICVGIYIYFRRFAKPLEAEAGNEEVALGETVGRDGN